MSAPILVPCLVALRGEYNRVSPSRDKRSDGWIGDQAHALNSSDHNPDETGRTPYEDADNVDEVHGLDVDDTGPWPYPGWFDDTVETVRRRHERGEDDRLQNIIRNGRIASRSWGWDWQPYAGANGHYEHAHFSARYTSAQEADTSPWGVEDEMTQDQLLDALESPRGQALLARAAGKGVHDQRIGSSDETIAQDLQRDETAPLAARLDRIEALLTELAAPLPGQPPV